MSIDSEKTADIRSALIESMVLWFKPYSDMEKEIFEEEDSEEVRIAVIPYFDYEMPAHGQWLAHIDFELDYPAVAGIRVRTSYEVNCIFEHFLTHECLDLLHEKALELTIAGFNDHCQKLDNEFVPLDEGVYSQFLSQFSDQAIKQCMLKKDNDFICLSNEFNVFTITRTDITQLLITATVVIMDEILYNNDAFDLKHNREVFHAIIPSTVYFTTKFKCLKISEGDVNLVMSHNIVFQTCLDCALQLLLERHLDTLLPSITKRGFTDMAQKHFIKSGTQFLEGSRKELQSKGVEITNLSERYDWNSLIK